MAFDTNTLTAKGVELLASATAAIPIILDGCDATTTYIDQASAIDVSARPTSPLSTTTDVSVIGATANHVMARAHFQAGTNTGGEARTLYLFGHAQNDPTNVYVIYVCSSQDTFHLPEADDVVNNYEALFDMIYSAVEGSVTTASTSVFCTLAEFNILKERVVTTHKEGDPNEGDPLQTVRGEKVFMDGIGTVALDVMKLDALPSSGYAHFGDDITVEGSAYINGGLNVNGATSFSDSLQVSSTFTASGGIETDAIYTYNESEITIDGGLIVNGDVTASGDIKPDSANTRTIGSTTRYYIAVYSALVSANILTPLPNAQSSSLGASGQEYTRCYAGGLFSYNNRIGHAVSSTPDTRDWRAYASFTEYDGTVVASLEAQDSGFYNTSVIARSSGTSTGGALIFTVGAGERLNIQYNNEYARHVADFSVPAIHFSTLDTMTVGGLTGNQPVYDSGTGTQTLKVGSILMAWKVSNADGGLTGRVITQTSSTTLLYYCSSSAGAITNTGNRLPNGTYTSLCDFDTGNANKNTWILVQCLSLD